MSHSLSAPDHPHLPLLIDQSLIKSFEEQVNDIDAIINVHVMATILVVQRKMPLLGGCIAKTVTFSKYFLQ